MGSYRLRWRRSSPQPLSQSWAMGFDRVKPDTIGITYNYLSEPFAGRKDLLFSSIYPATVTLSASRTALRFQPAACS
jgi:hypothetical protein